MLDINACREADFAAIGTLFTDIAQQPVRFDALANDDSLVHPSRLMVARGKSRYSGYRAAPGAGPVRKERADGMTVDAGPPSNHVAAARPWRERPPIVHEGAVW